MRQGQETQTQRASSRTTYRIHYRKYWPSSQLFPISHCFPGFGRLTLWWFRPTIRRLFSRRFQSKSRRLSISHYLSHLNEDLLTWRSPALTRRNFPESCSACCWAFLAPSLMSFTYSFNNSLLPDLRFNTVQYLSISKVQLNPLWATRALSVSASWYFSLCPRTLSTNGSILAGKFLYEIPRGLEDDCLPTSGEIVVRTPY